MASLVFPVVRADDLFQAEFRFEGFRLTVEPTPALERESDDARLVVTLPPQAILEQVLPVETDGFIHPPPPPALLAARRAGQSRLGFRIPSAITSLPLDIAAWLDWDRFEPLLPLDLEERLPEDPEPPDRDSTAIELPARVILSPGADGRWRLSPAPDPAGPAELWRAALDGNREIRMVWSPDFDRPAPPPPFLTAVDPTTRREAVDLTAALHLLDANRFSFLSPEEEQRVELLSRLTAIPITARRLELGPLGGSLAFRHDFPDIDLTGLLHRLDGHDMDHPDATRIFALRHWAHRTGLGRDLHVRTVAAGHLFPYGHRALRVDLAERALVPAPGAPDRVAWLVRQTLIVVGEEIRAYPAGAFPFATIAFAPDQSVEVRTPPPDTLPAFALPATGTDHAGVAHGFIVRMLFVPDGGGPDPFAQFDREPRDADLGNAPLAFVPPDARGGGSFPTSSMRIAAVPAAVPGGAMPRLELARILPEALSAFAGAQSEVAIAYAEDVAADRFARLLAPVVARVPAARAGGLAAPSFALDTLSRSAGLTIGMPGTSAEIILGAIGGRLFGFLDIGMLIDPAAASGPLPAFQTEGTAGARVMRFRWQPQLKPLSSAGPVPKLILEGEIAESPAGPRVKMSGELADYELEFAGLLAFGFGRLAFSAETGRPIGIGTAMPSFRFRGDLDFLGAIAAAFADAAPGTGPVKVDVGSEGLTASLALALPDLAMGQFNLLNLALATELVLRFEKPARIGLGLSSRRAPFLASYNGLGGGGFFRLTAELDRPVELEFAIELGAIVALDLIVVKGSAQVLVGLYVLLADTPTGRRSKFTGYVRAHGAVEVLGLLTVSLDVMLALTLEGQVATGSAQVTLMVQLLMFSRSVSFEIRHSFDAGGILPGGETRMALDTDVRADPAVAWESYCRAFAA
jgi:hypothetical protein